MNKKILITGISVALFATLGIFVYKHFSFYKLLLNRILNVRQIDLYPCIAIKTCGAIIFILLYS